MPVSDYNTDPNLNTTIGGTINIAEGCPPGGINNAIRQLMADVRTADNANVKLTGNQTISGTKTFAEGVTFSSGVTLKNSLTVSGGMTVSGGITGTCTSAGTATDASSLGGVAAARYVRTTTNNATVGSTNKPVYISAGVPVSMAVVASATNATNATNATTATNASSLGGTAAAGYVKNTGNQTFSGGVTFKSGMTVSGLASLQSQLFVYPDVGGTPNWVLAGSEDIFTGSATLQCYTDGGVKHNVITVNNATGDISFGGTATRANKLGTATVGASNKPIYLSAGIPVSMSVVASAGTATNATNYVSGGGSATIASIGGNGKTVRFPGGLQICYGSGTIATSGTDVSFGSAFSETPSIMVAARPGSAPTVTHCGAVVSASTTGAKLYFTDGSTLRGGNYFYTATGKWK